MNVRGNEVRSTGQPTHARLARGRAPEASHFLACVEAVALLALLGWFVPAGIGRTVLSIAVVPFVPFVLARMRVAWTLFDARRRANAEAVRLALVPMDRAVEAETRVACRGTVASAQVVTSPGGRRCAGYVERHDRSSGGEYDIASELADLELRMPSGEVVLVRGEGAELRDPLDASVLEGEMWIEVGDELTVIGVPARVAAPSGDYRSLETVTELRSVRVLAPTSPARIRARRRRLDRLWLAPLLLAGIGNIVVAWPSRPPPLPSPPPLPVVGIGEPCSDSVSCGDDALCTGGPDGRVCTVMCLGTSCPSGQVCMGLVCVTPAGERERCNDAPCGDGFECVMGRLRDDGRPDDDICLRSCRDDASCAEGEACTAQGPTGAAGWCQRPDEMLPLLRTLHDAVLGLDTSEPGSAATE